mmetsp:Transcript_60892/g.130904  ORF Transcript_60892/g.130904 Transcript_60892/m.130904 type:complete len:228 (-) Transcript_60892:596-1279(-)
MFLLSLDHYERVDALVGLFNILGDLDDTLVSLRNEGSCVPLRGVSEGEDRANDFLALRLLRRSELKGAELVHTESDSILGPLVECGHHRRHDGLKHVRLSLVVRARMQHTLRRSLLLRNFDGSLPRRGKQGARIINCKGAAEEVLCPLLPHIGLLLHQGKQPLQVLTARVRRDETVTLVAPVRKLGVEDLIEEALVLLSESRLSIADVRPESIAHGNASIRIPLRCA